ncbi:pyridoxal phosphate-dependent aminotransferase [Caldisalinibacter kiritimatiensis]|uniref:Aminotransferase n=1 Tax=Caldisalinibacter kiritimatiensis TaxID=1304284 RepID=R1CVS7_9FIRM|nr:histidinol-phosphate transaminase [Caldisalinibacter kiritimatiensis]EOD00744.1 L-threonine 3-O-phosphate decarboxylase [Caldisalinibacter kiritimatiensis]
MNKHGGYFGEKTDTVIDFSVNVNPLGVPKKLIHHLSDRFVELVRYPEIDGGKGKSLIAEYENINEQEIIIGNGATELIYLFTRAMRPKKALIIQPTFTEYERALKLVDCKVHNILTNPENRFNINLNRLLSKIEEIKPDLIVLCNPNNPTGTFTHIEEFKIVLDKLKEINACLFLDESFIDFSNGSSYISLINEYQIFIIRSMTKIFAIPGLRLGYGVGNKELIFRLNKIKEPWTINSFALNSIPILLKDYEYLEQTKKWYTKEKQYLFNELKATENIYVYKSEANYFLCKLLKGSATKMKEDLLNENIYIRTCEDFYGLNHTYIRVAVRSHHENVKLIKILNNYVQN